MGDKIVISKIELLYGRLFQIDLHNESTDEWYRVFADKDELYKVLNNAEKEYDMEVKLTEEEIMRVLECCSEEDCVDYCPLKKVNNCESILCKNALELIRKLKGGE